MERTPITRATLGRLPAYLKYLRSLPAERVPTVSATGIAGALGLGEVQVRKDLGAISGEGKPKIGYVTRELLEKLEECLGAREPGRAVIVGAGKLGMALLDYGAFQSYGVTILAAFDSDEGKTGGNGRVLPMESMAEFLAKNRVSIGIITVPESAAQSVCDRLVASGIRAVWNFAPCALTIPENVILQQENLALSLAYLNMMSDSRIGG